VILLIGQRGEITGPSITISGIKMIGVLLVIAVWERLSV